MAFMTLYILWLFILYIVIKLSKILGIIIDFFFDDVMCFYLFAKYLR